jgi:hypothetical protein
VLNHTNKKLPFHLRAAARNHPTNFQSTPAQSTSNRSSHVNTELDDILNEFDEPSDAEDPKSEDEPTSAEEPIVMDDSDIHAPGDNNPEEIDVDLPNEDTTISLDNNFEMLVITINEDSADSNSDAASEAGLPSASDDSDLGSDGSDWGEDEEQVTSHGFDCMLPGPLKIGSAWNELMSERGK